MSVERLRKVAEAATPGEWTADGMEVYGPHLDWVAETWDRVDKERGRANARHVATFDPPTVLALLDVVQAAEKFAVDAHDLARCRPHRPDARPCPTCDPFHEALGRLGGGS